MSNGRKSRRPWARGEGTIPGAGNIDDDRIIARGLHILQTGVMVRGLATGTQRGLKPDHLWLGVEFLRACGVGSASPTEGDTIADTERFDRLLLKTCASPPAMLPHVTAGLLPLGRGVGRWRTPMSSWSDFWFGIALERNVAP